MGREFSPTELSGWIRVNSATHYDAGNYTCVPSYATPAWTDVHILHGENKSHFDNYFTGWGISSRTWVGLTWIWRVPRLVGRYCSYLLPKHDGGTFQI